MTIEIAVVGSLNLDTTAQVRRLPRPGETVLGSGHFTNDLAMVLRTRLMAPKVLVRGRRWATPRRYSKVCCFLAMG